MKYIIVVLMACFIGSSVTAQQKDTLTKEMTIDYLNGKLAETIGHQKIYISQNVFLNKKRVRDSQLKKTLRGVELSTFFKTPDYENFSFYSFNPKHIESITNTSNEDVGKESPIGTIQIKFIGKVVLFNNNGDSTTTNKATIHFLQTDPDNYKRIFTALNYLKDLYKLEDIKFENVKFKP